MVKANYQINPHTLAILPAKQIDYNAIIITETETLYVQQTPLEIIKSSCYEHWTTYEGRRKAVIYHMNFTNKVPIPISKEYNLYFFPTHSPTNMHNSWIAAHHVAYITKRTRKISRIHFTCGIELDLNVSSYTLHQQKNRAYACMYKLNQMAFT